MIIGISGKAGSGKDTVADFLVRDFNFVKVALADPLKRVCKEVFAFTDEQLWGSSEKRNELDRRFPRFTTFDQRVAAAMQLPVEATNPNAYLTPRLALQLLGTEWGRVCYPNIWVEYALRVAKTLLEDEAYDYLYTAAEGLHDKQPKEHLSWKQLPPIYSGVVIPDVRFENEVAGLKKAGAKLIRVVRPGAGLKGSAAQHKSETEQEGIPDEAFDIVIVNDGTLEELALKTRFAMRQFLHDKQDEKAVDDLAKVLEEKTLHGLAVATGHLPAWAALEANAFEDKANEQVLSDALQVLPQYVPTQDEIEEAREAVGKDPGALHMKELLDQREADIKAGKLLEYDEAQKDVPPMLRKPKQP